MKPRLQFRLRTLLIVTAVAAVLAMLSGMAFRWLRKEFIHSEEVQAEWNRRAGYYEDQDGKLKPLPIPAKK